LAQNHTVRTETLFFRARMGSKEGSGGTEQVSAPPDPHNETQKPLFCFLLSDRTMFQLVC
jgi:hypothetical protein